MLLLFTNAVEMSFYRMRQDGRQPAFTNFIHSKRLRMHATRDYLRIALLFFLLIIAITSDAQVVLPAIFSDNMVLQYRKPLTVGGKPFKKESVAVSFQIKKSSYTALPGVSGLAASNDQPLDWFTIAGDNGIFVPAVPFRTDHLKTD